MEELWLFCEVCDEESNHEVLKSRTSSKKGFSFQGVVKCLECQTTSSKEVNEEPPISLKLRISIDNETVNDTLTVDRGVLIEVGQTRPHPGWIDFGNRNRITSQTFGSGLFTRKSNCLG